ncbi:MAG: hypothetical protein B5M53_07195 [Candidatus Cloacimonas sp. 4484_209]|nr:MAG: hypothetical protein B5M53_07195 [Candidatus Cloacimonas sp. 4484_209]
MNYYTILGVNNNATKSEIRKAYLRLAKKYHPDNFTDEEEAKKMHEKFSLIVKAYKTLWDDEKRNEYDKSMLSVSYKETKEKTPRTVQAKTAFKNGLAFYKKGDFWRAEKYFKSALSLSPDVPLYKSYLGLALVRQGRRSDEAIQYCKEAVEQEVYNSRFHVNLGIVYKIIGDTKNAIKCFEEALTWNDKDTRAQEELQRLKGSKSKNKGLFSRFFNRGG